MMLVMRFADLQCPASLSLLLYFAAQYKFLVIINRALTDTTALISTCVVYLDIATVLSQRAAGTLQGISSLLKETIPGTYRVIGVSTSTPIGPS